MKNSNSNLIIFYLLLGVNSWTSPLGKCIYAFVIITPARRQYVHSICDFSSERHLTKKK